MKTKLLKLALCAMAALPMGAWADIDFGTEKTVSQKTVWNFNSLTAEQEYSTVTEYLNAYLRVTHDSYKISVKATASENITLSDNTVLLYLLLPQQPVKQVLVVLSHSMRRSRDKLSFILRANQEVATIFVFGIIQNRDLQSVILVLMEISKL